MLNNILRAYATLKNDVIIVGGDPENHVTAGDDVEDSGLVAISVEDQSELVAQDRHDQLGAVRLGR